MAVDNYDLAIVGAGAGGLTAADFAVQIGAKVALIEKNRTGGDCTWTGCVPSKALLKTAKIAHDTRRAARFGIHASAPVTDMRAVRDYVRQAIQQIYPSHTPDALRAKGVDVVLGPARFVDPHTISVGGRHLSARKILLTTGAVPKLPAIAGLANVPFMTYERIFENDRLPGDLVVVGGGPLGIEITQAYQRLGAQVTVVANRVLPKDEPEARAALEEVLRREGVKFVRGRAKSARWDGEHIVIATDADQARADLLVVASGRAPVVGDLDLDNAGVDYSKKGIPVDSRLRTNVKHIYAAGDVVGGHQFSHLAAWQAFLAARNALVPGSSTGLTDHVPWVTFTDPEVAHIGLTEEQARQRFGNVLVDRTEMRHIDREMKVSDLAGPIHAYPTYSSAVEQLAAKMETSRRLSGFSGDAIRWASKVTR